MKTRDIVVGFLVLVIVVAAVLVIGRVKINTNKVQAPSATPSIQQRVVSKFNGLVIPQDEAHVELKDVSGGNSAGLATRTEILADLPDLAAGQFYQGWLENGGKMVLLGKLRMAKGGWILDYNSSKYPGYNKVVVTLDGKHILEGSF